MYILNNQTNQEFQRDMNALWNQPELIEKRPIKAQSRYKEPNKRISLKNAIKAYKTKNNVKLD
jgi:alpha-mannosidase